MKTLTKTIFHHCGHRGPAGWDAVHRMPPLQGCVSLRPASKPACGAVAMAKCAWNSQIALINGEANK
jgi:hypothetical protein